MHKNTLSLQNSLAVAITVEERNIRRYREWALRFSPFDRSLRLLLERQASENESHKQELLCQADRLLDIHEKLKRPTLAEDPSKADHFFIIDQQAAIKVLREALELTEETWLLYRYFFISGCRGSILRQLFKNFASFKEVQIGVLQQAMEQFAFQRCGTTPVRRRANIYAVQ